jgi:predicted transcriptional regulator
MQNAKATKAVQVRLTPAEARALARLAKRTEATQSAVVRRLITDADELAQGIVRGDAEGPRVRREA